MSFPFKGVVFDWAWTLVDLGKEDDRPAFHDLVGKLESMGFPVHDEEKLYAEYRNLFFEQIRSSRKSGQEALFSQVLNYLLLQMHYHLTAAQQEELIHEFYVTMYAQRKVFPDVPDTLEKLKEWGIKMAVVSNTTNPGFMKEYECRTMGLESFFEFGLYSSEFPFRKPHPSIFRLAVKRLALEPSEILFVGDHYEMDVVGSKRVGMAAAWLNREKKGRPEGPHPDFEIFEVAELLSLHSTLAR